MLPQAFILRGVDVMAKAFEGSASLKRYVLVELEFHRVCGRFGTGKSSSAEAAAKAIAAQISLGFKVGKSARISSGELPAARLANTVRSVTLVPLKTGAPPQICGSWTMRSL
jgi:hypothetical protein